MRLKNIHARNDMPYGWISSELSHKKIYNMWYNMLERCYCNTEDVFYKWYKDCKCHTDFLLLSNFVKWIEQEPRYQEFCDTCDTIKWTIDKDGIVEGNKEYTPGKIRLVTNSENVKERNIRCKPILIANPYCNSKSIIGIKKDTQNVLFFKNTYDAERNMGFIHSCITMCLKGKRNTHKGYKWFYTTDIIGAMNFLYKN